MSFRHDLCNLYYMIQENAGQAAPPVAVNPQSRPPLPAQQEQQPVKPETVHFDFVLDNRRAAFFAHLVYNAMHKVAKTFDLVNVFVEELGRIHRKEKRNHQLKQLARLR